MKKTITKITFDSQSASNNVKSCTKKLNFNLKRTKQKLAFAFVLLTGLTFGQTVVTLTVNTGGASGTGFNSSSTSDYSSIIGTLSSSTNFTISFQYQTSTIPINVTINDGTSTTTNSLQINAPSDFSTKFNLVVNKTTLNHLDIIYSQPFGIWKNLLVQYTTGTTVIKDFQKNVLNIDSYCNANTLYIKNTENISNVKLEVYNLSGQLVLQENDATKPTYELNLPKGIYTVRLSSNDAYKTSKIIIE